MWVPLMFYVAISLLGHVWDVAVASIETSCFSGLPAGVVNMVYGVGPCAGEALVTHPDVPLISFTGSTTVGKRIQEKTAPFVKRLSLEVSVREEAPCMLGQFDPTPSYSSSMCVTWGIVFFFQLGGKNAGIVFDDVDLEKCLPAMIKSSFANQGEICLTTSRIYIQKGIYKKFLDRFVELTK